MPIYAGQDLGPGNLNTLAARASRSTTQSAASGALTAVNFNIEDYDNANMFAPTSTNMTLPVAGLWAFAGYAAVATNATGYRRLLIEVGVTGTYVTIDQRPAVAGDNTHMSIAGTYLANAGDQLRLIVQQNSGAALNITAGASLSAWLIISS
ncbi:hypothetical protein [Verrucosispora sp. TAA-831]|uniref:hypothetical protein n=1 Tax=Verrucosispora sp. TAA-831 TaxID=3422227 RepID=UPI003D6FBCD7